MSNEKNITFMELQILAEDLDRNKVELKLFLINRKIDVAQLSDEYDSYRRTCSKYLTPIEYLNKNYSSAIQFIVKTKAEDDYFDEFLNINEETFHIRKNNGHVSVHALNIIYHLSMQ